MSIKSNLNRLGWWIVNNTQGNTPARVLNTQWVIDQTSHRISALEERMNANQNIIARLARIQLGSSFPLNPSTEPTLEHAEAIGEELARQSGQAGQAATRAMTDMEEALQAIRTPFDPPRAERATDALLRDAAMQASLPVRGQDYRAQIAARNEVTQEPQSQVLQRAMERAMTGVVMPEPRNSRIQETDPIPTPPAEQRPDSITREMTPQL